MVHITASRSGFPALSRQLEGRTVAYLDGPGGTQVHGSVIEAMTRFMDAGGSNLHGPFVTSVETDIVVNDARSAVADLFNAQPNEIVFGQNMTSLTYAFSRALSRTWRRGDNIVVTRLDHDANVAPWLQAAKDAGVTVRDVDFNPDDGCTLDLHTLTQAMDKHTKLVAFTHASNAGGPITPVAEIVDKAHRLGALTYVDAVHYTPHGLVDVQATDTDFLIASAYKWFGPHTGCFYGKASHLESIKPYKLRPAPDNVPDRWETGTQAFESLAGVTAAVDYVASLGSGSTRRDQIVSAYGAITEYEAMLSDRFLSGIAAMPGVKLFGQPTSKARTPTFAIDVTGTSPADVAKALAREGIFVWDGDYYAYEVMRRLRKSPDGLVRIGFVHYNTPEEVDRTLSVIEALL